MVHFDAVRLENEDACRIELALLERNTRRPDVVSHAVLLDASLCPESDLNSVLCRAGCRTNAGDAVLLNRNRRSKFISCDPILLVVMHTVVFNRDPRRLIWGTDYIDPVTALAAV